MKNKYLCFMFFCLSLFLIAMPALQAAEPYKIVGYYPNWAMYRDTPFYPKDIDAKLLTHINYAFVKIDTQGNFILFDPWADVEHRTDWNQEKPYWGNFLQLKELKEKNPHLKTLVSVGGWTLSDPFSEMAENPKARENFIRQAIAFTEKYGFDGIDIDWEYPGFAEHSGRPQDKENFNQLLMELHQAAKAHEPPLLVTIAAPAGPSHYKNMDVATIHQFLDWINLMTYDFYGPWGGGDADLTNHHSGLYASGQGNTEFNADVAVNYYLSQGVPSHKIVFGMPFYGRSYANVSDGEDGLFKTYSGAGSGTTNEAGMRFFYDIKQNLLSTYTRYWDDKAKVPYLYNPQTREYITYDDEESLAIKGQYIKDRHLGGAMVWELGLDTRPSWDGMKAIYQSLQN